MIDPRWKSKVKSFRLTRHKPLRRSRKPIRKLGRVGKLRKAGMRKAMEIYGQGPCQLCGRHNLVLCPHHKKKRSDRGTEDPKNMLAVCWANPRACHERIHADKDLFEKVKASSANVENREIIDQDH